MAPQLTPMTEAEFEAYLEVLIPEYAQDNVDAGHWHEAEALEQSRKSVKELLPKGLKTDNHHFFVVREGSERIGIVWLRAILDSAMKAGFIFDIAVDEAQRGKGYGRQTMLLIEQRARELGLEKIGLHVFGKNKIARKLYESLGYEISSLNMSKAL
jgi:ribosomal protein S18 acetylase RimI-like enzyme